jgi:transcriptional regulator with XRE-family HTH domain
MKARNMTILRLAQESGLPPSTLRRVLFRDHAGLSVSTVVAIARVLGSDMIEALAPELAELAGLESA